MIKANTNVSRMNSYNPPMEERIDKLRYDFNENLLGPSPKVIDALRGIDPVLISAYPEYGRYYQKFSTVIGVDQDQLILTNGTDEAIKLVMETFLESADEILLPEPTFSMYRFYAGKLGLKINSIPYNEDMSFPYDNLMTSLNQNPKMVVLVNPNNPTGTFIKQEYITHLIEEFPTTLFLVDEAYFEFLGESSLSLISRNKNLIVLRTFSKSVGLAGLRIGVAMGDSYLINQLRKSSSPYSVSSIAAYLASIAIDDSIYVENYVDMIRKSRIKVSNQLSEWGFQVFPSKANFVLVNFGPLCKVVVRFLKKKGILLRDRSNDLNLLNCVRITLGTDTDTDRLLSSIDEIRKMRALIFDMDGVLVDVSNSYRKAIALTVKELSNSEITTVEIQNLKNEGGYNNDWKLSHEIITRKGSIIDYERVVETFQNFYLGTPDNPGLIGDEKWILKLQNLKEMYDQFPLYILTGRPRLEAIIALDRENVKHYFDYIVSRDDTPERKEKPDPWGLHELIRGHENPNILYFGDTVDDMQAALNAGIVPIGIINDESSDMRLILKEAGASAIISTEEIGDIL